MIRFEPIPRVTMLLTVRTAAHRLGVGYSTLKQWIYSGKVRTTTTAGGHHRIADAEIDRLTAQTQPSRAEDAGRTPREPRADRGAERTQSPARVRRRSAP